MSQDFPGDLYGRLLEEDLGPDYYEFSVHLTMLRLINDWLVTQSCFFVVLPMPDNLFIIIVKSEMRFLIQREIGVQEGLLREAIEED